MNPTGDFDRLRDDIMSRYGEPGTVTFGVLIADARQRECKEYIINYLNIFHEKSGEGFDFFIPGYSKYGYSEGRRVGTTTIGGQEYFFSSNVFEKFINELERNFGIRYTFNPMLILFEVSNNHFGEAKRIVIELDALHDGIRRSGELFLHLFDIVNKKSPGLKDINLELTSTYIKGSALDFIINALDIPFLTEIRARHNELRRFRIQ